MQAKNCGNCKHRKAVKVVETDEVLNSIGLCSKNHAVRQSKDRACLYHEFGLGAKARQGDMFACSTRGKLVTIMEVVYAGFVFGFNQLMFTDLWEGKVIRHDSLKEDEASLADCIEQLKDCYEDVEYLGNAQDLVRKVFTKESLDEQRIDCCTRCGAHRGDH